ncbi:MAG: DUF2723 domain-containing protein [Elusimicrobia bacterium]|nr:DUF2723 domain-containing protein [Elusimicrobiota bacterium]
MKQVIVFVGFLAALLVYHACGGPAPFRDAGEFAVAAAHLSVAHPPGYPFYTLFGKLWATIVPFGTVAYRLNILSALSAAAAFFVIAVLLRRFFGVSAIVAAISAGCLVSTRFILALSFVSEMYTVGLLWLAVLIFLVHDSCKFTITPTLSPRGRGQGEGDQSDFKSLLLAGLLFPLALGTRMDMALAAVYVIPFFPIWLKAGRRKHLPAALLFAALGGTIFLYLLIRSNTEPLVNWGDPSTFERLINSLIRKSYGSTVDLLSESYRKGELFWLDFKHWTRVCWETFGPLVLAAPLGLYALAKSKKLAPSLICWLVTCPVFLYLANLPPNPHALKILEDHFIPSLLMVCFWVAVGLEFIIQAMKNYVSLSNASLRGPKGRGNLIKEVSSNEIASPCSAELQGRGYSQRLWPPVALNDGRENACFKNLSTYQLINLSTFIALSALVAFRSSQWSLRRNFYAYDYAVNLFRSAPPGAVVVLHEDVQLFSAWEAHLNRGKRPDLNLMAQGLSGSAWYQNCLKQRWGYHELVFTEKLENAVGWESFVNANKTKGVYAGFETSVESDKVRRDSHGLLVQLHTQAMGSGLHLSLPPSSGGVTNEDLTPWLFFVMRGTYRQDAEKFFFNGDLIEDYSLLRPLFPQAATSMAFYWTSLADWPQALFWWQRSREKLLNFLNLARQYRTLDEVAAPLRRDMAYILTSLGVVHERLGSSLEQTAALHKEALQYDPVSVMAHYNLAATYWRMRDGAAAVREFEAVLQLDPNHAEARKYLAMLKGG